MSQPYQPVSTIQALNWCRKHCAYVRFWPDGTATVGSPNPDDPPATNFYAEADTLVLAVCAASRDAWEHGWDLGARGARKRDG